MNVPAKKRLGELLIEAGVIDATQLKAALGHQRQWGIRLGQSLVDLKLATEHDVVKVLAKRFGFEVARLDQIEAYAHQQALSLVPREFAVKNNVFPLAADTATLSVAMADPTNLSVVDELRFRSGRRVKVSIGGDREVAAAIQAAYPSPDGGVEAIALDIDESGEAGEPVMASFGGGSNEDYESFFGTDAAHLHPHEGAHADESPFAAGPAPAPVPVPGPDPAARPAPQPAAAAARPAPVPRPGPAAQPTASPGRAQQPAPTPSRAPTVPAVRTIPQPAGVAAPAAAATPPAAPPPRLSRPTPAPIRAVPPPGAAAPRPGARPAAPAELQLPSPDALRDARVHGGQTGAGATARADPEVEEELSPLVEEGAPAAVDEAPLTPAEQAVLAALQRLADGGHAEPEVLKPTQAIAVLIRILLRKGLVTQRELLDALRKP
jgi:hypothetical protein